jgi:hypothetical protein
MICASPPNYFAFQALFVGLPLDRKIARVYLIQCSHPLTPEVDMLDRSEISRALAKAIAYKQCGKQDQAERWARVLVELLECAQILTPSGKEE